MRWILIIVSFALITGGCATRSGVNKAPPALEPRIAASYGRVVRINPQDRYVILECNVLPDSGREIMLYRDQRAVGRVKIADYRSGNWVAADIINGTIMSGDWFMLEKLGD
ncbi:MAG TPA: hypothetical protein PJ991_02575 [Kiritimatiellia bacterium]|nr:hypothetical protein [Kiritimatiellia bacterium]